MKVYLFISNHKKLLKMYLPYIEALNKQLDITNSLVDADIVLIIGAWTWQGAQIAKKAKQMDIPYIVCPLGDISERNCKNHSGPSPPDGGLPRYAGRGRRTAENF